MIVQRVGIVAKRNLVAASEQVSKLGPWLRERGIEVLYERDTAKLAGAAGHGVTTVTPDALPREVDLVIVLGGDVNDFPNSPPMDALEADGILDRTEQTTWNRHANETWKPSWLPAS